MSVVRHINKQDILLRRIKKLIHQENKSELKKVLQASRPEDIATLLSRFTDDEKLALFGTLSVGVAGIVLNETDSTSEGFLLKKIGDNQLAKILTKLPNDEAADILSQLDEDRSENLLNLVKEPEGIEELLNYPPESAGGIMSTQYIAVRTNATARSALTSIRKFEADDPDLYHIIYVIDEHGHLMGNITLSKLLKTEPARRISKIYKKDSIRVQTTVDQEEVAKLVSHYNLINIPVVDESNILIGVVYVEDVIDVINEEATEDIYKMAGIKEEESSSKSIFHNTKIRLPWLLTTLIGSLFTSLIINHFQPTLDKVLALAAFMPVIAAMSGNIGVQSSSIVIRGLATGHIAISSLWKIIFREFRVGLTIGFLCGILIGVIVHFWKADVLILDLGMAVGIAMSSAMTVAATMGSLIPFLLQKIGVDPAIATGPFVTTINDITGLSIYFFTANLLIG